MSKVADPLNVLTDALDALETKAILRGLDDEVPQRINALKDLIRGIENDRYTLALNSYGLRIPSDDDGANSTTFDHEFKKGDHVVFIANANNPHAFTPHIANGEVKLVFYDPDNRLSPVSYGMVDGSYVPELFCFAKSEEAEQAYKETFAPKNPNP